MTTKNKITIQKVVIFLFIANFFLLGLFSYTAFSAVTAENTYVLGQIGGKTVSEGELLNFSIKLPAYFGSNVKWTVTGLPEEGTFYEVPAFPGAEGFGAGTSGGRGGKIVKVTNLNRDGAGSLAAALALDEPRIIVFDVSGVIEGSPPKGEWLISKAGRIYMANSAVTIAGQTAPGAGITINGELCFFDGDGGTATNNVIARFIRSRSPYFRKNVGDNILAGGNRAVFDHISGAWGDDENFDFSNLKNASVQWCGVEESAGVGTEWEALTDKDQDGMYDYWEEKVRDYSSTDSIKDYILDILPNGDIDGDGYTNLQEYRNGTNPSVANSAKSSEWIPNYDSDGDGMADWWELKAINYSSTDSLVKLSDINPKDDLDGDLSTNLEEYKAGTNPLSAPSHNYGMIMGYDGKNISLHHNFFAHHSIRTPLTGVEILDHRNNLIYNADLGITSHPLSMNQQRPGERFKTNIIGNYFKAGPNAPKLLSSISYFYPFISGTSLMINESGNYFDMIDTPTGHFSLFETNLRRGIFSGFADQQILNTYTVPKVVTQSATVAYDLVRAHAGALPRDQVTSRNIEEISTRTGRWGKDAENSGLTTGLTPTMSPIDSDNDGMPDEWETAVFTLPNGKILNRGSILNASDGTDHGKIVKSGESVLCFHGKPIKGTEDRYKGYTYIEYYIDELADQLILEQLYENGYDETFLPGYGQEVLPTFSWVPSYHQAGIYLVNLKATDDKNNSLTETIKISVDNTNRKPYIYPAMYTPAGTSISTFAQNLIEAGNPFDFEFYIIDIDGNSYDVSIDNLPNGASFSASGKKNSNLKGDSDYDIYKFSWTPTAADVGKYGTFTISVANSVGESSSQDVMYKVIKPSKPVYAIHSEATAGGYISPDGDVLVQEGNNKILNFFPDTGYVVSNVVVDDVSLGAISAYIFSNITKNHTIKVAFEYNPTQIDGLVLKLDFSGNLKDSSGLGNHGTATGDSSPQFTNDRFGNLNSACFFDGINDYITIKDSDYFNLTEYSISAWMYGKKDLDKLQYILSKNSRDGADAIGIFAAWNSLYASGTNYPRIVNVLKDLENKWLHIAIVRKLSSVVFYLNGEFLGESATGYNEDNDLNLLIGARSGASVPTVGFFGGVLDDVRIYNHALSAADIAQIAGTAAYTEPTYTITAQADTGGTIDPSGNLQISKGGQQDFYFSPLAGYVISDVLVDGLSVGAVSSYSFKDVSANHTIKATFAKQTSVVEDLVDGLILRLDCNGDMTDSSGYGNDGESFGDSRPELTADRFSNSDSAYLFDGSNDYILVPTSEDFNLSDYTISTWIFGTRDFSNGQYILSKNSSDCNDTIGLFTIWNHLYSSGTNYPHIEKIMTDLENQWIHLVLRKKEGTVEFFVNGVYQGSAVTGATKNNSLNLIIGARNGIATPNFRFFKGALDDVRIYNRALSNEEITVLTNLKN